MTEANPTTNKPAPNRCALMLDLLVGLPLLIGAALIAMAGWL